MDKMELRRAFDEVFDQALVVHGFADYMRDYDLYVYLTAETRTGSSAPGHRRYRFTHCVRARDYWAGRFAKCSSRPTATTSTSSSLT